MGIQILSRRATAVLFRKRAANLHLQASWTQPAGWTQGHKSVSLVFAFNYQAQRLCVTGQVRRVGRDCP